MKQFIEMGDNNIVLITSTPEAVVMKAFGERGVSLYVCDMQHNVLTEGHKHYNRPSLEMVKGAFLSWWQRNCLGFGEQKSMKVLNAFLKWVANYNPLVTMPECQGDMEPDEQDYVNLYK